MNELAPISKMFNDASTETKVQIVENVYQKVIQVNSLAPICNSINQKHVRKCPKCGSTHIIFNGKRKGIQYYFCKKCKRNFNEFTGTTISYIKKKEHIKPFLFSMLSGLSLAVCSKIHHIAIQTAFDWRHKILSSIKAYAKENYYGITEMITTEVKFSRKGQGAKSKIIGQKGKITDPARNKKAESVEKGEYKPLSLVAISDRTSFFEIKIVQQGNLDVANLNEQLGKKLNKVKKLCLDDHLVLQQFAGKKKISYFINKEGKKAKACNKYYHTKNIKIKYFNLNIFMNRFYGVSSSYLQNYLYWYMLLDLMIQNVDPSTEMIEKSISVFNGKEYYKNCKMFA